MRPLLVALVVLPLLLPAAGALPTPGLFCDQALAATGRLFPEADQTNDFVSYAEARCGLSVLLKTAPQWVKMDIVGKSAGWDNVAGGHDPAGAGPAGPSGLPRPTRMPAGPAIV